MGELTTVGRPKKPNSKPATAAKAEISAARSESGNNTIQANVDSPGAQNGMQQEHEQRGQLSCHQLVQRLRADAAHVPQEQADSAQSHADALEAALAVDDERAREVAVGRIETLRATCSAASGHSCDGGRTRGAPECRRFFVCWWYRSYAGPYQTELFS
ncbi:hypothetical protein ACWD6R_21495 [Streptomyces sp. NPDC005151]